MFSNKSFSIDKNQQGIALPLSRLRQVAFNAAETALRDAELSVLSLANTDRRELFFSNGNGRFVAPSDIRVSDSELCQAGPNGGFCIPTQFNTPLNTTSSNVLERWADPALDVFNPTNNPSTSIAFSNFATSNLDQNGVIDAPRYIVEFLGNFDYKPLNVDPTGNPNNPPNLVRPEFAGAYVGACRGEDGDLSAPNDVWPYCASDPGVYRITVRATAGPVARRASVTIQSILRATGE